MALLLLRPLSKPYILFLTVSIALVSLVICDGEWYYDCNKNPLECTYGKTKYDAASCSDRHPNCREYALRGNCIRNAQWMEAQCSQSCGICPTIEDERKQLDESTITPPCVDHHPQCPKWASEQECFINPAFIYGTCPMSCIRCVVDYTPSSTASNTNKTMSSQAKIQAQIHYAQTDFGVWQSIPRDDINLLPAITQTIVDMGEYAQELLKDEAERIRRLQEEEFESEFDKGQELGYNHHHHHPLLGPSIVCNNIRHDCATLVAQHGCYGPYMDMMMQECSFACRFCHETHTYHQCRSSKASRKDSDRISLESSIISSNKQKKSWNRHIWKHLSTKHGAINLAATTPQDEWVVSLNFTAIWNKDDDDDAERQRYELLQVARRATYVDEEAASCSSNSSSESSSTLQQQKQGQRRKRQQRRSSSDDSSRSASCNGPMADPTTIDKNDATTTAFSLSSSCQHLEQDMANLLGIGSEYLEPLEFVHFEGKSGNENISSSSTKKKMKKKSNQYARQIPMSEFDNHDQWKPSGHVLLTVLLVLQPAKKGGAIGFPELDWLLVTENPQILIWPTSQSTNEEEERFHEEMTKMKLEILPVIQGDMYFIKIYVRQYPYTYTPDCH